MSSEEELDYDDDDEEVVQPKRRGKKSKKNKDPNKPKRNMSAYFLYSNANRAQIKADNPEASFGDLVSARCANSGAFLFWMMLHLFYYGVEADSLIVLSRVCNVVMV